MIHATLSLIIESSALTVMSTRALRKAQKQRDTASSATKPGSADASEEDDAPTTTQKPSAFAMLSQLEDDESEDADHDETAAVDAQQGYGL